MVLDVDRLVELEAVCQGEDAWSETLVRAGAQSATWLLEEQGRGYAVLSVAGDIADLQRIGVDPEHRRQGIATELLRLVVAAARSAGARRLLLEVSERNAGALAFYRDRGFVGIDRRPRYYKDASAAEVMQLSLVPEGA